jgi:hypothetical protein
MQAMLADGYHLYTGWLVRNDGYNAWLSGMLCGCLF